MYKNLCSLLLFIFFLFVSTVAFSQSDIKEIIYRDTIVSNGDLMIRITEAHSVEGLFNCKMEVIHPLREYMVIRKNGISLSNESSTFYMEKDIELFPYRKKKINLQIRGNSLLKGSLKLKFNNVLISSDSTHIINIDSIAIPARHNEQKNYGDYSLVFTDYDKGKGIVLVQYAFKNNSNNIVYFNHSEVKLSASGIKLEQYKPNPKPYLILPNDSRTFTTKFILPAYIKKKSFSIDLGSAAVESELIPANTPGETILTIDYQQTSLSNKATTDKLIEVYKPESIISDTNKALISSADNFTSFKYQSVLKPFNEILFRECSGNSLKADSYIRIIPVKYTNRLEDINKRVSDHIPSDYRNNDNYRSYVNAYIYNQCYIAKNTIIKNNIYVNWMEMEEYLEKVLYKTIPVDTIKKYDLKIFITNDPDVNAYVVDDGSIFINVGYFASINNEAELASTIAHEVSHYLSRDMFFEYIKAIQQYNRNSFAVSVYGFYTINFGKMLVESYIRSYSRECESNADLNGLILSRYSDYDQYAGAGNFELFYHLEQKYSKRKKDNNRLIIDYTHPNAESRYYDIIKNIKPDSAKKLFMVDECLFYKLKQQSIFETLDLQLNGVSPYEALEYALNLYLRDPGNQKYIYYVMESLRRVTYREPALNNEPVFMDNYLVKNSDRKTGNDPEYKTYLSNDITDLLCRIFYIKPDDFKKFNIMELFTDGKFNLITYKELFNRFLQKINKDTCTECLLTAGLKRYTDDENYYDYIKEYTTADNAKYKDFASVVLKNDPVYKVGDKELLVWNNWYALVGDDNPRKDGLEYIKSSIPVHYLYLQNALKEEFPGVTTVLNIDNTGFDLSENIVFKGLTDFLDNYEDSYNEKLNVCLYNPFYYNYFKSKNIGKIHFLDIQYISNEKEISRFWLSSVNFNRMKYQVVKKFKQRNLVLDKDVFVIVTSEALKNNNKFYLKN